jgi:hypothetical protein
MGDYYQIGNELRRLRTTLYRMWWYQPVEHVADFLITEIGELFNELNDLLLPTVPARDNICKILRLINFIQEKMEMIK